MNKKKAISIIVGAAKQYHEKLEDQKVLFAYEMPSNIRSQLEAGGEIIHLCFYEVAFHRSNFLHLTGVIINNHFVKSSIHFYQKCLEGRLSENDFEMAKDGSTDQKLDVLRTMMDIKKTASMIGDFTGYGPKLYSEKIAGNTFACMGFMKDKYSQLNVPNTLLKKDVRDITSKPQQKIFLIMSKKYSDDKYVTIDKCDKAIKIEKIAGIINYTVVI